MSVDWGSVAAVVGAGLGSTGLAGVLTGGIQLTRRSRLRKSIEASHGVLASLDDGTASHTALKEAIAADGSRLAALTLVGFPRSTVAFFRFAWLYVVVVIGFAFVATASTGPQQTRRPTPLDPVTVIEWALAGVTFLVAATLGMSAMLRERRDRFVALTARGVPPIEAVKRIGSLGPLAQAEVYLLSALSDRPPRILPIPWAAPITVLPRIVRLVRLKRRVRRSEESKNA